MQSRLPVSIDPIKAAQRRLDYVGFYPAKQAVRLAASVAKINSDIAADLSFAIDNQGLCVISLVVQVNLQLICQRCNQPFACDVTVENTFSPVRSDSQVDSLPEQYEIAILNEFGEINLLELIEDEIILSLPIVPVHDSKHCEVSDIDMVFGEIPEEESKPNPFAILASLKKKE